MALSCFSLRRLPVLRNALLPALLAVSACSAGESAAPAAPPVTSAASASAAAHAASPGGASGNDRLATLLQAAGVQCADANMAKGCTAGNVDAGDFYDVELSPACGNTGFFAGVAQANGVDVLDAVPTTGSNAIARARLAQGQVVCIQAIGRAGQTPLYYYVIAIPADTVAQCKNNPACGTYGDRPIQRSSTAAGDSCHAAAPGQYVGECAQGWVGADALDVFSNGIESPAPA
ncbi:hypothetical protein FHY11_002084 [Xanthomonas arboricola]|uniref:hypothetical protein n=1 Tax=Xanthomonas euroxanthea TaxID=2259622 RepID=UPI00141BA8DC|nr:hypothetical protein [Xanthomonas euroxanthea]NIK08574.1 hypothetical protein [Xanthomonas euroxanthea]